MKRFGFLYEKIIDKDNLYLAFKKAKKDKSHYREVKQIANNLDFYIKKLHVILKNHTYKVGRYKIEVKNDKGKERVLYKLPFFPDRVVQWAILLQLEPIFMRSFTINTSASIKGRGIHHAYKLVDRYIREGDCEFFLKIDVRKFYDNIDKVILKEKLNRKFKDEDLLNLLFLIIDSFPKEKGIPIGSYLSQFLANFYLTDFDHFIKEKLKCKNYIRYMDDIVVMSNNKKYLHNVFREIYFYLNNLNLEVKNNFRVSRLEEGLDFVGYVFYKGYKRLRKSTKLRLSNKTINISKKMGKGYGFGYADYCSINSYKGWLKWCNSSKLSRKYFSNFRKAIYAFRKRSL